MTQSTFTKLSQTDKPLYGPRKLLLCGFSTQARPNFLKVLEMACLADVPVVWADGNDADTLLSELMSRPGDGGSETDSDLPRAVVVGGIAQKELPVLMSACRQAGMGQSLWAVLTPTSETWTLKALLTELEAERCAMQKRKAEQF